MRKKQIISALTMVVAMTALAGCGSRAAQNSTPTVTATEESSTVVEETTTEEVTTAMEITEEATTEAASTDTASVEFDLEKGIVTLNNGIDMPLLGIGTFGLSPEEAENSVTWALEDGYRLIDTANAYYNERAVGRGMKNSGVPREEIFLTTKLWPSEYSEPEKGIDETLARLDTDYIDLLLLHQAAGDYITAYQGMEQAVKDGKVKSIGISNFSQEQFEEIMQIATITPAVNQIETHPYFQETEMMDYMKQYGTVLEAWFPLSGRGNTKALFDDPVIKGIADAHGKSSAQIILRWHLQADHVAIPGSGNADHIQENISIFDFELTDEEMEQIRGLDKGASILGDMATDEDALLEAFSTDFNAQE